MNKKFFKFLKISSFVILLLYIGICALLYFNQDDLLFHPKPNSQEEVNEILKINSNCSFLTQVEFLVFCK